MPTRVRLAEVGWETVGMGLVFLVVMLLYVWWTSMDVMLAGWVFLGFVAVIFLWRYLVSDVPPPLVAGSGWVGNAYGRGSRVVAVYELTRIDAGPALDGDGEPIPGTVALHLSSPGNPRRDLRVDLARLQTNPALWDLVHHGITHSIAAGAELTEEARKTLRRP